MADKTIKARGSAKAFIASIIEGCERLEKLDLTREEDKLIWRYLQKADKTVWNDCLEVIEERREELK